MVIIVIIVVAEIGLGGGGGYCNEYFQERDPRLVKQSNKRQSLNIDSVKNLLQWFIHFVKGFLHWVLGLKLIP